MEEDDRPVAGDSMLWEVVSSGHPSAHLVDLYAFHRYTGKNRKTTETARGSFTPSQFTVFLHSPPLWPLLIGQCPVVPHPSPELIGQLTHLIHTDQDGPSFPDFERVCSVGRNVN